MFQMYLTVESTLERVLKARFVDDSGRAHVSIRSKDTASHPTATGSFQWTPAVQGLMILLVRYHLHHLGLLSADESMLKGEASSPASSLDYAISKQPGWLLDMFGILPNGLSRARTLFKRINSERKQGGAVSIFINQKQLPPGSVGFHFEDSTPLDSSQITTLLSRLESRFIAGRRHTPEGERISAPLPLKLKTSMAHQPPQPEAFEPTRQPRKVDVVSLIPAFVGPASVGLVDTEELGNPAIRVADGALIPSPDGFGVLVSRASFSTRGVTDFLYQRRARHVAIINGQTRHQKDLNALRRRSGLGNLGERDDLCGIAYVMSVHQVMNVEDEFSVNELRCMAEPSLLGIGDDPSEEVPSVPDDHIIPDASSADISFIGAPHFRCYITWANVLIERRGAGEGQAEQILRFEVLLQRVWYKLHFLDQLLRLNKMKFIGQREFCSLVAGVRQEFFDLTRPDPRATSHFSEVRKALVRTSRISELFEVLQQRERSALVA